MPLPLLVKPAVPPITFAPLAFKVYCSVLLAKNVPLGATFV